MVDGGRLPLRFALITFIIAFGAHWATKSHRVMEEFMGVNSLITGSILEDPLAQKRQSKPRISATPEFGEFIRRYDELPLRPYFHARIPRITVAELIPQTSS